MLRKSIFDMWLNLGTTEPLLWSSNSQLLDEGDSALRIGEGLETKMQILTDMPHTRCYDIAELWHPGIMQSCRHGIMLAWYHARKP